MTLNIFGLLASAEVTDSNKHPSLLLHKINYSHKKFIVQAGDEV
jgi:hypothetical protein